MTLQPEDGSDYIAPEPFLLGGFILSDVEPAYDYELLRAMREDRRRKLP
jgi:hypothetical protein